MANGITVGIVLTFIMLSGAFLLTVLINILLVPIIKTPRKVISEIIDAMNLKKDDSFVDLGCGDGKVVLEAYTNAKCKCYGLDLSPIMIILARTLRILKYPANKDIVFEVENIYEVSLKDFTKIYCYLDTKSMGILKKKLQKFIKDGGEVFSYKYGIEGMKEKKKVKLSNDEYLYIYS
ncbi:MAG: class I SAM-dependent methyltransferase [Candidatus Dojkabacteria bacterium]|jgi:SAM-dependent methyltransferase